MKQTSKRSEKELIFSTLTLFIFSIIGIFAFMLTFLRATQFTPEFLIYAMGISIIIALPLGYLLAKHAIAFSVSTHAMLSRLTNNILHELNIPLSTIKGNVHLIKRKTEDESLLRKIARIEKASDDLLELYEDMEYAIKREIKEIDKEKCALDRFIAERVELLQDPNKEFTVVQDLEKTAVIVDKQGLKHAFDNLFSNAMKYGKKGGTITIRLKNAIVSIQDEGKGIEPTEIAKIFNRYYQSDSTLEGRGIGLALVKEFCDNHKIKIEIDSQRQGTTFLLDFSPTEISYIN